MSKVGAHPRRPLTSVCFGAAKSCQGRRGKQRGVPNRRQMNLSTATRCGDYSVQAPWLRYFFTYGIERCTRGKRSMTLVLHDAVAAIDDDEFPSQIRCVGRTQIRYAARDLVRPTGATDRRCKSRARPGL